MEERILVKKNDHCYVFMVRSVNGAQCFCFKVLSFPDCSFLEAVSSSQIPVATQTQLFEGSAFS